MGIKRVIAKIKKIKKIKSGRDFFKGLGWEEKNLSKNSSKNTKV